MTLYLKYRPQTISELDLERVREQLTRLVASGRFPHAFLFSGPKGTGKTSAARILAKVVNCEKPRKSGEPCNKCGQCIAISRGQSLDVIEMDAASNRGIDDIRALRENIALSPNSARKKVYIIDEVHMLTTEAANAFLKTLEEPPEHVIFILATTDPQKLPATIHSRLTNIVFTKASEKEIGRQLRRVVRGEKLKIEDGVLSVIAKRVDGSFRDAVKVLESLIVGRRKITLRDAKALLLFGGEAVDEFAEALEKKDLEKSLGIIEDFAAGGGNVRNLVDGAIEKFRVKLLNGEEVVELLELLIETRAKIPLSPVSELPLEMLAVKWCASGHREFGGEKSVDDEDEEGDSGDRKEGATEGSKEDVFGGKGDMGVEGGVHENGKALTQASYFGGEACLTKEIWRKVVETVRSQNVSVDALLRAARPMGFDGKNLKIGVYYQFHKEKLEDQRNRMFLEDVLNGILGFPVRISCALTERTEPSVVQREESVDSLTRAADEDIISAAEEIFGS